MREGPWEHAGESCHHNGHIHNIPHKHLFPPFSSLLVSNENNNARTMEVPTKMRLMSVNHWKYRFCWGNRLFLWPKEMGAMWNLNNEHLYCGISFFFELEVMCQVWKQLFKNTLDFFILVPALSVVCLRFRDIKLCAKVYSPRLKLVKTKIVPLRVLLLSSLFKL